ncbi:metal-dependent hydrolase [Novosphingobium sp.]|uniref:metal-dependent hydrolase n=1 Tax=Novosphingobium sp. TaxID=1874826 RepID=UPI001D43F8C7|nr:metal-dependent hydrolase [Novosphingobium sp.]MBX9661965.1 metal-dependent hydrolase [Novosphingobium sp.]
MGEDSKVGVITPIAVRQGAFAFADDTPAHWIPHAPELAQMINGASFTMPHLEPFLVATLGEAAKLITDPAVRREARDFCMQETQHYRTHRRFNDVILGQGYGALAEIEADMARSYARLAKRPLAVRLAYAAGFEAMTLGLTDWLVGNRAGLFRGADPHVTSFILWHMVEETEHKLVAHDVYQAVTPGYWRRAFGVLHGSLDVIRWSRRCYRALLLADGRWRRPSSRIKVWWWAARFLLGTVPALLRAMVPGHDPRAVKDHPWVAEWIAGHERTGERGAPMPLIDTQSAVMPVPF